MRLSSTPPSTDTGVRFDAAELLALGTRARELEGIAARTAARHTRSGTYLARTRGRGMEYMESRPYSPGDDARTIDWRVTARSGRAHTKLFREERERPVSLVVDFSPSMFFGTRVRFKSVAAARAAALVAWAVTARGDRVGALVSAGDRHLEVRPQGGTRGVVAVVRALVALGNDCPPLDHAAPDGAQSTLAGALGRARRVLRPGSLVFVLSDFYGLDDEAIRHMSRLRGHDELVACWVHDPLEIAPPPPGRYPVTDGQDVVVLDAGSAEVRAAYLDYVESFRAHLGETCARLRVPVVPVRTDGDEIRALRAATTAGRPIGGAPRP